MTKTVVYRGIWANITDIFPAPILATILASSLEEVNLMASNRIPVTQETAGIMTHLCKLHGAAPVLFQHEGWKDHKGVLIGSVPEGWMAWTMPRGWGSRSRYIGSPALLTPCTPETIAVARAAGWPA
jgi:hypothetical protein